jgi:hypothetical protein
MGDNARVRISAKTDYAVRAVAELAAAAPGEPVDVIRAVDGPLAAVSGERPQNLSYGELTRDEDAWLTR